MEITTIETPLMKQYSKLKKKYPDAILFFETEDFYETFNDDAIIISEILNITLAERKTEKGIIKLAGFNKYHLDQYLPKLVKSGNKVAICNLLKSPKPKLVKKPLTILQDCTNGYLSEAFDHAEKINDMSIYRCLDRLAEADINCKSQTKIYPDFAPHSFAFARIKDGKCITNGGIIFHGKHDGHGSGSAPTFSVSITKETGWSIHT